MNTEQADGSRMATIALWGVTIVAGASMTLAGVTKFASASMWVDLFVGWGYPPWLSFVIGALEIAGALAVFVPRFATYGATLVAVIMCGAAATVLMNPGDFPPAVPIANIVVFSIIAYARRGVRWMPG